MGYCEIHPLIRVHGVTKCHLDELNEHFTVGHTEVFLGGVL